MATIGQALTAPESGWKRLDDTDTSITYGSGWTLKLDSGDNYNRTDHFSSTGTIRFNFTGTRLRIISTISTSMSNNIEITIDGNTEKYSGFSNTTVLQALNYEKTGLHDGQHSVVIINKEATNAFLGLDAIDIDANGQLKPYAEIQIPPKLILKNPSTNKYYSLGDKTLILLSDGTDETISKNGLEAGQEVRLDVNFDKTLVPSKNKNVIDVYNKENFDVSNFKMKKINFIQRRGE